ncbi:glycosyltransferase [Myxacorys almedinensis A]|uniref:Glycosyltransferase n=2 Tax=Myxacorys TaxID=2056239 RepID=A0A8J7YX73_9CYAN|nr:glycosyltransferase [Myxacorys almedinensis A]
MINNSSEQLPLSIVIPCFNQGEFIGEALSSIEQCRDPVYEIIIVNDGSTDPFTINVFNHLKQQGYTILNQSNQGLACARNNGIANAQGQYILALDADNKIRPAYIYKGIEILDHDPEIGVVYGDAEYFGERNDRLTVADFDADRLLLGNYIDACAVFRKGVWEECGGYDETMPLQGYEDWDLWLNAMQKGWKFYHVPDVLFDYRVRSGSMISICKIPENKKKLVNYVCTKHRDLYTRNLAYLIAEKDCLADACWNEAQQLRTQLNQAQAELEQSHQAIATSYEKIRAMESSRFWQFRTLWFQLKRALGLLTTDVLKTR